MMLRSEPHAWLHGAATVAVITAGWLAGLQRLEWIAVAAAIAIVWTAEAINTAIESLGDAISADINPAIGRAKDVAAGAVLISAIGAAAIGLLVFGPALLRAWP